MCCCSHRGLRAGATHTAASHKARNRETSCELHSLYPPSLLRLNILLLLLLLPLIVRRTKWCTFETLSMVLGLIVGLLGSRGVYVVNFPSLWFQVRSEQQDGGWGARLVVTCDKACDIFHYGVCVCVFQFPRTCRWRREMSCQTSGAGNGNCSMTLK